MEAIVFAAYETNIDTAILEETTSNHSISSGSISIDNRENEKQYPILEITSDDSNITEVEIGGNTLELDETLSTDDVLLLDFKNQEYKLNDTDIVEDLTFSSNDRPVLEEDSTTDINITFTNDIEVEVTYSQYEDLMTHEYVQDFRVSVDKEYTTDRSFKSKNKNKLILQNENYNISFSNLAYDWKLYEAIENDVPIKITYKEDHTNGDKEYEKHLLGVKFSTYERYYRDSTGILFESLVGEGTKLL